MSLKKISKLVLIGAIASSAVTTVYVENPFNMQDLQAKAATSSTYITTENVKFRQSSGFNGTLLFVLKKGNKVKVMATKKVGGIYWAKVQWQNHVGWIAKDYLKLYQAPKITTTSVKETVLTTANVNLRKSASTSTAVLATIPKGTKFTISKTATISNVKWAYVSYNSKKGWVSYAYLKKYQPSISTTKTVKETVLTTANVNLRKSASTSTAILATIPKGTKVTITKIITINNMKWAYGSYNGKKGWISYAYLKKVKTTATSIEKQGLKNTIILDELTNLYYEADNENNVIAIIPKGQELEIKETKIIKKLKWAKVQSKYIEGWIILPTLEN